MPEQQSSLKTLDVEKSHLFADDELVEILSDLFARSDKDDFRSRLDAIETAILFLAKRQSYE